MVLDETFERIKNPFKWSAAKVNRQASKQTGSIESSTVVSFYREASLTVTEQEPQVKQEPAYL